MSLHRIVEHDALHRASDVVICTANNRWVIPYNCQILKALLVEKNIQATDLQFASEPQCHNFIKRLLLLAAEDECLSQTPSQLAQLARGLIFTNKDSN